MEEQEIYRAGVPVILVERTNHSRVIRRCLHVNRPMDLQQSDPVPVGRGNLSREPGS